MTERASGSWSRYEVLTERFIADLSHAPAQILTCTETAKNESGHPTNGILTIRVPGNLHQLLENV